MPNLIAILGTTCGMRVPTLDVDPSSVGTDCLLQVSA